MRFAISIPRFVSDGEFDPAGFRAYMARAEALGFESAWTLEQPLGMMPFLSPLQTMSYAAACTERIRPGCVVFVTPLHSPVHLAKDLSTLDQLSRGRIDVGVGTGGRHRMFSAFQVDPTSLVARFNEGLRLMKALWTEPRVNFDGRFWQLKDAGMEPKPFQKRIPRSGSAPAIPMRCGAPPDMATASSVRGRPRRNSSPSRCRSCGRRSPRRGATRRRLGSATASTSPSPREPTPRAPDSASAPNA